MLIDRHMAGDRRQNSTIAFCYTKMRFGNAKMTFDNAKMTFGNAKLDSAM